MARREKTQSTGRFVLFDVLYEDGLLTSNRKVPTSELGGIDGDAAARTYVEAEDRKIAQASGKPRAPINSVSRAVMSRGDAQTARTRGLLIPPRPRKR